MFKKFTPPFIYLFFALSFAFGQIQSPDQFLGYKLGSQFTPHYRIADYFKYVAQTAKNVKLVQFGSTYEGRPLMAMFIASPENIGRLEEIRHNNLSLTGIEQGAANTANTPVIVWLSYNVHGNEPSSSEAAMMGLYDMVDPNNTRTQQWLKNTVVVIDPCLNPDGRERYVNFYNSAKGKEPNPNPGSREHIEPWPQGRTNHYNFDLNRDWAWQTQKETKARLALFNQWLPEIHVDFHEQGYNAPYYFAPAAEPFHKNITAWQKEFQTTIGKNNAKYFDEHGWMYFTREEFDLLYPSYGDTYPIYNGSIGMTYEQGGIGAGLSIITRSGDTLTLADRIAHHHSNALSTVETASANATKILQEFKKYYTNSLNNPPGEFKTYVIKNDNADKIQIFQELLKRNGIRYRYGIDRSVSGFNYFTGKTESYHVQSGDMVISAYQPKSVLLNVLLEPKTFIADSATYDITAWSLPYAYGLQAYGLKEAIKDSGSDNLTSPAPTSSQANTHAYAYVSKWESVKDVAFLAELIKNNIKVRYAERAFEAGGKKFPAGSLLITHAGNMNVNFDKIVSATATKYAHPLIPLKTGFIDKGADLGSGFIKYIREPKVLLITGQGTSAEAAGEVWHFFEEEIDYPVTLIPYKDMDRIKLNDFNVAIFPDGNYDDFPAEKLQTWVKDGGKLIAMDNAIAALIDKKGFSIKKKDVPKTEDKKDKDGKGSQDEIKLYGDREKEFLRSSVPGAIYRINLDNTHPLGFGLSKTYYTLKLDDDIYNYLGDDGWNVGTIKKDAYQSGFVGQKSKARLKDGMLIGVQSIGRGSVVYLADDPLFRSFWENGKLLFSNAVFLVGQ